MERVRNYETMFVLGPDLEEEDREKIMDRIKNVITGNDGEIKNTDEWGTRRMAYEVNDYTSGYYTVVNFEGRTGIVSELEHVYKIMDQVIRHLIVREDD